MTLITIINARITRIQTYVHDILHRGIYVFLLSVANLKIYVFLCLAIFSAQRSSGD